MSQTIVVPGDFSGVRHVLPSRNPVNLIPPDTDGLHYYIGNKYNVATGELMDAFGANATFDFAPVATFGKPAYATSSVYPGGRLFMQWTVAPTPRMVMKNSITSYVNKFTIHLQFLHTAASVNNALFSFVSEDLKRVIRVQCNSGVDSKAHLITHVNAAAYTPLGTNTLTPVVDALLTYTPTAMVKEVISISYDGTLNGGTFYVYRAGALINTVSNAGEFVLNGSFYLGTDALTGSNISDFKGILGAFMVYEKLQTASQISAINSFLVQAFP